MSLFANIEFNNEIASPFSPQEFIKKYVFGDSGKVYHSYYDKEKNKDVYEVFATHGRPIKLMTITITNMEQK